MSVREFLMDRCGQKSNCPTWSHSGWPTQASGPSREGWLSFGMSQKVWAQRQIFWLWSSKEIWKSALQKAAIKTNDKNNHFSTTEIKDRWQPEKCSRFKSHWNLKNDIRSACHSSLGLLPASPSPHQCRTGIVFDRMLGEVTLAGVGKRGGPPVVLVRCCH